MIIFVLQILCSSISVTGYEVKVLTADKKQAGTGNNVHLVVVGEKGTSKEIVLKNSQREQKFQRGQTDSFQITIPDTIGSPIVSPHVVILPDVCITLQCNVGCFTFSMVDIHVCVSS